MGKINDRFKGIHGNPLFSLENVARSVDEAVKAREALKGTYLGNCNITACQRPGAVWFNRAMDRFYCRSCAHAINAPGWPLGDKTPVICFERGIYIDGEWELTEAA